MGEGEKERERERGGIAGCLPQNLAEVEPASTLAIQSFE